MNVISVEIKGDEVFVSYDQRGKTEEVSWPIAWAEKHDLPPQANDQAVKEWAGRQWLKVLKDRLDIVGIRYAEADAKAAMVDKGVQL